MKNSEESNAVPEFYRLLLDEGSKDYVANVDTTFKILKVGEHFIPLTINKTEWENSYVVSPYAIIPYMKEEMKRNCFLFMRLLFAPVFLLTKWLLKGCRVNKVVMVNNHPLSTNLYPKLTENQVKEIHFDLLKNYPDHAIIFRSLNPYSEGKLMLWVEKMKYRFVTNRSIYFYAPNHPEKLKFKHRHKQKKDRELFQQEGIGILPHESFKEEDALTIKKLYDQLYLEKYSYQNPQFTEPFFKAAILKKTFSLTGIRFHGKLVGVMGYFERNGIMTPPIVGYDTALPQSLGLYRMLTVLMFDEAKKKGLLLHMSSGAAEFKRGRGCHQEIESMGVFTRHLPLYRRIPWFVFSFLFNKVGKPILIRKKL